MHLWKNKTIYLFIVWLCIVPPATVYSLLNYWPSTINWAYFSAIILFAILSALFPVRVKEKSVYLVLWVTVPAFLFYGVVVELIAMQVVILTVALLDYKTKIQPFKLLARSLSFFVISFLSALAFHLVGGQIGMLDFWPLMLAVVVYQFTQRITYATLYTLYYKANNNLQRNYIEQISIETLILFLVLPFTLTLYYLIHYVGVGAFFLLGIPFFSLVIILRKYNHTEKINDALKHAGDLGQRLSHNMTEEGVIDEFIESVAQLFEADFTYLYDYDDEWIEPIRFYENNQFQRIETKQFVLPSGVATALLNEKESLLYRKRDEWVELSEGYSHPHMQSMFAVPILCDKQVTGILVVASKRRNVFQKYQLQIAEILCSYFTVSMVRARNIEQTILLSERCGLTSLYNYHYLEDRLNFEFNRFRQRNIDELTILLVDIDFFKKVNDTYGHESGNEVLIELADILESHTPTNGIVGRYGGEEFMYILPNYCKDEGISFGETLRIAVENHRFTIHPNSGESCQIAITLSIGVAAIPNDTDELQTVVRNADRALYLGAKRAGRNRVAGYVK